jgi:hypothetical protein
MLKETASVAGAAIIFSPLGMPIVAHGLAGLVVGNLGLYLVDVVLKDIKNSLDSAEVEERPPTVARTGKAPEDF